MSSITVIQYTNTASSDVEARRMLGFLASQEGYIGGRVLPPSEVDPTWRVQAFFSDPGVTWLPDGCRKVVIMPSLAKQLGINKLPA